MITNPLAAYHAKSSYRWVLLAMCVITPSLVVTMPNLSLPPLFVTIGADLELSLVQLGTVWGIGSFAAIFFSLVGGTLGDRFGTRATLFIACLLTGLAGVLRAFAVDFGTLLIASLLYGIFQAMIPVVLFKLIRQHFPPEQLGMASGVISAGFASGLMLGPLLSTSVLLPALGGWRQVILFYGIIALIISFAWLLVHPAEQKASDSGKPRVSLIDSLRHVAKLRNLWLLGIGSLGISACFQGFTGYLPTYLKTIGWNNLDADRALSVFFLASLSAVVPLSILSDRTGWRRGFLVVAGLILSGGIGLLGFIDGSIILIVIGLTGLVFDAFMAISNTNVLEVDGVGFVYAGTAVGFSNMIRNLGGTFSPAIGNSLAIHGPSVPFLFWGAMGLFGVCLFVLYFLSRRATTPEVSAAAAG
jgi:MFS family permease